MGTKNIVVIVQNILQLELAINEIQLLWRQRVSSGLRNATYIFIYRILVISLYYLGVSWKVVWRHLKFLSLVCVRLIWVLGAIGIWLQIIILLHWPLGLLAQEIIHDLFFRIVLGIQLLLLLATGAVSAPFILAFWAFTVAFALIDLWCHNFLNIYSNFKLICF